MNGTTHELRVRARDGRPALDLGREVHALLGLVFDPLTVEQAAQQLRRAAAEARPCFISTPNVNFAVVARTDSAFRDSVLRSDLSLADGAPIVWLARALGVPLPERVAGSDVFERLRRGQGVGRGPDGPIKVFFFGGPDGAAQRAGDVLNAEAGGVRCVGALSPGFGSIDEMSSDDVIARINASGADFVVVSIGAKKGQAWILRNRQRLRPPLITYFGAVVNFVAGGLARAPHWMRRSSLEWLWRIKEEPALWRRYARDGWTLAQAATAALTGLVRWRWLTRARAARQAAPRLDAEPGAGITTIRLHGAWSAPRLAPLRQQLAALLDAGSSVQLDLSAVTHGDSALLGLIALVDRWQVEPRAIAAASLPSPALRAAIDAFGVQWLLPQPRHEPASRKAARA